MLPPPHNQYFKELFRVSKNQIIWGANHMVEQINRNAQGWLFGDKGTPKGLSFADGELAWTSFNRVLRKVFIRYSGAVGNDGVKFHPTTKPIALYKYLLNEFANKGDKILDTHFGSLSIGIACHDLGFDLTAIEIDKDYYDKARHRLSQHQQQLKLF